MPPFVFDFRVVPSPLPRSFFLDFCGGLSRPIWTMMDTNRLLLRILILFLALGFSALPHFAAASSSPLRQQQPKQTDWPFNDAEFNPRPNAPLSVPIEPLGTELFNSSGGEGRARLLPAPPTAAFASCLASLLPRPITRPRLVPRPDLSNPSATSDILINNYKSQRYRYWQQSHDNTRSPALFVLASTEPQLVAAIKCANRLGLNWVARGGGHSYEASALPEGLNGVVIDLGKASIRSTFRVAAIASPSR